MIPPYSTIRITWFPISYILNLKKNFRNKSLNKIPSKSGARSIFHNPRPSEQTLGSEKLRNIGCTKKKCKWNNFIPWFEKLVKVGITPGHHPHPDFLPEDKHRMLRNPNRPYLTKGGHVHPRNGLKCCFQVWPRISWRPAVSRNYLWLRFHDLMVLEIKRYSCCQETT